MHYNPDSIAMILYEIHLIPFHKILKTKQKKKKPGTNFVLLSHSRNTIV